MSLADYTIEFEELLYCLEKYEIKLPPVALAYQYLNSANLTEVQITIVRTTISVYTYDSMVKQVKTGYSESKQEQSEEKIKVKIEDESYEFEETFYSNMRSNERDNFRGKGQTRDSYRGKYKDNGRKRGERQKKPIERNTGEILMCNICESIFHFVRDCPDYVSGFPKKKNEIKLQYYTEKVFHTLSEEYANMAVLVLACNKTVCGEKLLAWYLELLPEDDKKQVIERKSDVSFRFADSVEIKAIKSVEMPARIVGHCTSIKAEVVSKDILLLLSKKALKDAKVNIDFVIDKIAIFGSDLDIICSMSGLYCIPIFSFKHIDHETKVKSYCP